MTLPILDASTNMERARRAFSAQAPHFDSDERTNAILKWMRNQVYMHEEEFLSPGDSILELNAGTGIDAVYFAGKGHTVFAIDNAEGMLDELRKKVASLGLESRVGSARCSFTELESLPVRQYDHVFSNFGGLNCIPDLHPVTDALPTFLKPGATVTFVMMPRVCPWELLHIFRGNIGLALRRFSKSGTRASIDGHEFLSYYFSPARVAECFDERFSLAGLRGLASLSPPPYLDTFPEDHPLLYRTLTRWDSRLSAMPPFNRWADHFILTMKFLP